MQPIMDRHATVADDLHTHSTRLSALNYQNRIATQQLLISIIISATTMILAINSDNIMHHHHHHTLYKLRSTNVLLSLFFFFFFFLVFLITGHDSFDNMTHSMSMLMCHPHLCPFPFPQHWLNNASPLPRWLSFSDNQHTTNTNYDQVICHHLSLSLAGHSPPAITHDRTMATMWQHQHPCPCPFPE